MSDIGVFYEPLMTRSGAKCELCGVGDDLQSCEVPPRDTPSLERCVLLCRVCREQAFEGKELDAKHWYCLRESIWSEVDAVLVTGFRILKRLESEGWAQDLLGQVYLAEEVQTWANAPVAVGSGLEISDEEVITLDCNGAPLADGDSVTLIKDLDVKGAGFVAKRGTMVRQIRLIDDPDNIEGRVNKITLVLKTKFLKRVSL